ncbi:motility protein A [Spirochaeta cellobiosiphila]|uniref:motility protein A n=1 Tax=Spirochaeta cellobiosiphila TaxID=504483 RepID=UPI000416DDAB|nr:motility protein A [Spirochaeta cellobiosiphila]
MDISTILGIVLGLVMILMSIVTSGGKLGTYVDIPSIFMVFGGSFCALLVANPLNRVLGMMKYLNHTLKVPVYEKEKIIQELVSFSESARKEGLLSLDDRLDDVEDEFMKSGMRLVVDGTDPDVIKKILYNDMNQIEARHQIGIDLVDKWGAFAPAFGMIGTLAGLVAMMQNLEDKSAIGSGMAVALLTTFYGSIVANLILIPLKTKLEDRHSMEMNVKEIMIEGILSIQSGDNPRILEQKLFTFLAPADRASVQAEIGEG